MSRRSTTLDGGSLVLDHLELVPVGIEKSKRRAPFLLLHGLRNLDAVLAESRLLLLRIFRREEKSGVPLLRARVRAEVQPDVRTPWRDGHPMGPRRHDAEADLLLPELRRLFLRSEEDRYGLALEHGRPDWTVCHKIGPARHRSC